MDRESALKYVSYMLDDALNVITGTPVPEHARLVGWQCGFEPMFVAVWSYLPGVRLDAAEAEEIATEYLNEIGWFGEGGDRPADYII